MTPERLIDVATVARACGVTPQTVRNWVRSQKIRGGRTVTGRLKIPASELARMQKMQKVQNADV